MPPPTNPAAPKRTNGWTPERRAKQAAAIRRWQPWTRSTGPKTAEGKARASMNARRHGMRGRAMVMLREALRDQRRFRLAYSAFTRGNPEPMRIVQEGLKNAANLAMVPPHPPNLRS